MIQSLEFFSSSSSSFRLVFLSHFSFDDIFVIHTNISFLSFFFIKISFVYSQNICPSFNSTIYTLSTDIIPIKDRVWVNIRNGKEKEKKGHNGRQFIIFFFSRSFRLLIEVPSLDLFFYFILFVYFTL